MKSAANDFIYRLEQSLTTVSVFTRFFLEDILHQETSLSHPFAKYPSLCSVTKKKYQESSSVKSASDGSLLTSSTETSVFHFPFSFWELQYDALFLEARSQQFFLFSHLQHSRQTNRVAPSPQSNTKNGAVSSFFKALVSNQFAWTSESLCVSQLPLEAFIAFAHSYLLLLQKICEKFTLIFVKW